MTHLKGAISHHEREIAELRADRDLASEYLKAAIEALDHPDSRPAARPAYSHCAPWRKRMVA